MSELALNDLQVSAFLHAKGFRLVRTEGPANRKTFIFADVPDSVIHEFYAGAAEVNARKLFESYRTLRSIARHSFTQERNMNHVSNSIQQR